MSFSSVSRPLFVVVASMFAVACSSGDNNSNGTPVSDAGTDSRPNVERKVCLLSDIPGDFDDRTYVATAFRGVQDARTKYGWRVETQVASEATAAAFGSGIDALVKKDCTLLVAVAALYGDELAKKAQQYPNQKILALDSAPSPELSNVWGQTYAVNHGTFLAGYVAAAASQTKKVAVIGGLNIPPIQQFLDGFWLGVKHYNDKHGTTVEVLGWDINNRGTGAFINTFTDVEAAKKQANDLLAAGADVIFPVAGGAGYGAADAVVVRGNALVIGVDVDWGTQAAYENVVLTSVLKKLDVSINKGVLAMENNTYTGATHAGTLSTGEIDIAPFHKNESRVPASVVTELEGIRAQIIAGTLPTLPAAK